MKVLVLVLVCVLGISWAFEAEVFEFDIRKLAVRQEAPSNYCGATSTLPEIRVFPQRNGTVADHTGGGSYLRNMTCYWVLNPGPPIGRRSDWQLVINWTKIDMEYEFDWVAVYSSSTIINPQTLVTWWTGYQDTTGIQPTVINTADAAVVFYSDPYVVQQGFSFNYYFTIPPRSKCSGNGYAARNGACICYSGFGGPDCNQRVCNFSVCRPPIGECIGGYCQCVAGFGADCSLKYCQSEQQSNADSGQIRDHYTNGDYLNNVNCSWLIQPFTRQEILPTLTLDFDKFNTEYGYDFVSVYDGTDTNSPLIGRFSGTSIPPPLISTTGALFIVFTTDVGIVKTGFTANYTVYNCPTSNHLPCSGNGWCLYGQCNCQHGFTGEDCSQKICACSGTDRGYCNQTTQECVCKPPYSGDDCSICDKDGCPNVYCSAEVVPYVLDQNTNNRIIISDHTGGGDYRLNSNCTWTISKGSTSFDSIVVAFSDFDLTLNEAFVTVSEGVGNTNIIAQYTGATIPPIVIADSDNITINFYTMPSSTKTRGGFTATISGTNCNDSCSNHGACALSGDCICDEGWRGPTCAIPYCYLDCSGSNGVCGDDNQCHCNTGFYGPGCTQTFCNGLKTIVAQSGTITDHSQGETYQPNSQCSWNISLPASSNSTGIVLIFTSFALQLPGAYLSVYDNSNNSTLLGFRSSSFPPDPIITQSRSILVTFTSDSRPPLTGFSANFFGNQRCSPSCGDNGYCFLPTGAAPSQGVCVCLPGYGGAYCQLRPPLITPLFAPNFTVASYNSDNNITNSSSNITTSITRTIFPYGWNYFSYTTPSDIKQLPFQWTVTVQSFNAISLNTKRDSSSTAQFALYASTILPDTESNIYTDTSPNPIKYIVARGDYFPGTYFIAVHSLNSVFSYTINITLSCDPRACGYSGPGVGTGKCNAVTSVCECEPLYGGLGCTTYTGETGGGDSSSNETVGIIVACIAIGILCLIVTAAWGFVGWLVYKIIIKKKREDRGMVDVELGGVGAAGGTVDGGRMREIVLKDLEGKRKGGDSEEKTEDTVVGEEVNVDLTDDEMSEIDTNVGSGYQKMK
eukprot:TRINITY_DN2635_c0_g1_i1.p1 TRINITY_DN2635_c0_g1~~TRINITY_DN2635_c0_g1_i1.p1  ORF type:complete len:1078 (-),score=256.28 TRINITY_DN2635_c0_g1_i1:47-3280(-)